MHNTTINIYIQNNTITNISTGANRRKQASPLRRRPTCPSTNVASRCISGWLCLRCAWVKHRSTQTNACRGGGLFGRVNEDTKLAIINKRITKKSSSNRSDWCKSVASTFSAFSGDEVGRLVGRSVGRSVGWLVGSLVSPKLQPSSIKPQSPPLIFFFSV